MARCPTARAVPVLGILLLLAPPSLGAAASDLWVSARAAFEQALYPSASESLRALLRDYPTDPLADDAEYLLALCRVYTGVYDAAARALEQYPRRYPGSPYLRFVGYWLGYSRYHLGQSREATAAFRAQVDNYPAEAGYLRLALSFLGELYERAGSTELALQVSRDLVAAGATGEAAARAHYRVGAILLARQDWAGALAAFTRIRLEHAQSEVAPRSLYYEATSLQALGQLEEAERRYADYLAATERSPGPEREQRETAHLVLARAASRAGGAREVLRLLSALLAEIPASDRLAELHSLRAQAWFDLGDLSAARGAYEAALSRTKDAAERQRLTYNIAVSAAGAGDRSAALAGLEEAEKGPDSQIAARSRYRLAVVHAELGAAERAIPLLQKIVATGGAEEPALRLLGDLLEGEGRGADGMTIWSELVRRFPGSPQLPRYLYRLGTAAVARGDHAAALDAYNRLLREAVGRPDLVALAAEARYGVGFIYSSRGEYVRSLPFFEEAAAQATEIDLRARSLLAQGIAAYNIDRYDTASRALAAYLQIAPDATGGGTGYLVLGKSELRAGRLEAAANAFRTAGQMLEGTQEGAEALYWLGVAWTRSGEAEEAGAVFETLARTYPGSPRAAEGWLRSGVLARAAGDAGASLVKLDASLELLGAGEPSGIREEALYERALTCLALDRATEARRSVTQLAREYPASALVPEGLLRLAQATFEAERYRPAAGEFQEIARLYPRSAAAGPALFWSAESWRKDGDADRAAAGYWEYAKRYPGGSYLASAELGVMKALGDDPPESLLEKMFDLAARDTEVPLSLANRVRLGYATALFARGRAARAAEVWRVIVAADLPEPERGQALLLGARLDRAAGRVGEAVALLTGLAASRADRVGAEALLDLGSCLVEQGKTQEAVAELLRVAVLYPQHADLVPRALDTARLALEKQGDTEGAKRIADRLRAEYPQFRP